MGQPTTDGISEVIKLLHEKIIWTNLREEPVLYINTKPFVLRNYEKPYKNIEYTGIGTERIESVENRLKAEILAEVKKYNGSILLHLEAENGIVPCWETIDPEHSIFTIREVYENFQQQGVCIDYARIPITDEMSPEKQDFDALVERVKQTSSKNVKFVFNCQMGRGRTTTGMVVGCLLCTWLLWDQLFIPLKNDTPVNQFSEENVLLAGHYQIITELRRLLKTGQPTKQQLDAVIDRCGVFQNLREAIYPLLLQYRAASESKKKMIGKTFTNYLERYFYLFLFAGYVERESGNFFSLSFAEWVDANEFEAIKSYFLPKFGASFSLHTITPLIGFRKARRICFGFQGCQKKYLEK